MDIRVNRKRITFRDLLLPFGTESVNGDTHAFGRYSDETLDSLYRLRDFTTSAHVALLFDPRETEKVMCHINNFETFRFTLVPQRIEKDIYETIFQFFLFSGKSVAPVTWMASLVLRPFERRIEVAMDDNEMRFPPCPPGCPLSARNCSRELLFLELYHPMRALPSAWELETFCGIQVEYSRQLAERVLDYDRFEAELVGKLREDRGIRRPVWSDPYGVYGKVSAE